MLPRERQDCKENTGGDERSQFRSEPDIQQRMTVSVVAISAKGVKKGANPARHDPFADKNQQAQRYQETANQTAPVPPVADGPESKPGTQRDGELRFEGQQGQQRPGSN